MSTSKKAESTKKKSSDSKDLKKLNVKDKIRSIIKSPKEKFLSNAQEDYWKSLDDNQIIFCSGPAGVGKSYIAMKKALDLLYQEDNKYEKILIIRPAVEAEEKLGALPGDVEEKLSPYIYPSYKIIDKIIGKESREKLKEEGIIEIAALAYMRGWTVDNTIVIFEEAQNATPQQIKLLVTRIGYHSKFFISGDLEQSDRYKDKTKSGLFDGINRLKYVKGVGTYEFEYKKENIVRNPIITDILSCYSN